MKIIKAGLKNLSETARLFDLYRQFYECPADTEQTTRFIKERMEKNESDIFLAIDGKSASGFVQLYPSFCSVDMIRIYILYDLYVEEKHRKSGIGESLMNKASQWAKDNGALRLDLLTHKSNAAGQHLYEKLGYKKVNEDFYAYSLNVA